MKVDPLLRRCSPRLDVDANEVSAGSLRVRGLGKTEDGGTLEVTLLEGDQALTGKVNWEVTHDDSSAAVLLKPEAAGPLAHGGAPLLGAEDIRAVSASVWVEIVRGLLQETLGENARALRTGDELGKRIGVVAVNNLMNQERILKSREDDVAARFKQRSDAVARGSPALVTQADTALKEASKDEADQRQRVTASIEELEAYSPWVYPAVGKDSRARDARLSLEDWKQTAIGFVTDNTRYFARHCGKTDQKAVSEAASNPGFVRDFLGRHANWRNRIATTLARDVPSKADQNELFALLVLAHLDEMVAAHMEFSALMRAVRLKTPALLQAAIRVPASVAGAVESDSVTVVLVGEVAAAESEDADHADEGDGSR